MSTEQGGGIDHVTWTVFMPNGEIQVRNDNVLDIKFDRTLDLVGGWYRDYGDGVDPTTSYVVYRADGSTHSYNLKPRERTTTFGRKVILACTRRLNHAHFDAVVTGEVVIHDP